MKSVSCIFDFGNHEYRSELSPSFFSRRAHRRPSLSAVSPVIVQTEMSSSPAGLAGDEAPPPFASGLHREQETAPAPAHSYVLFFGLVFQSRRHRYGSFQEARIHIG